MLCKQCHKEVDSQSKFCPECGCALGDKNNGSGSSKNPSRWGFWFKALGGGFVILVVGISILALMTSDPAETIEGQLEALHEDHVTEAYYHFTAKTFQETVPLDHFRQFLDQYPSFLKIKTINIINQKIQDHISSLEVLLSTIDGIQIPVQYRLIKEGKEWKILSIKFEEQSHEASRKAEKINAANSEFPSKMNIVERDPVPVATSLKQEDFESEPLVEVVQKQLEDLHQNNVEKAYREYTAEAFKKATTLKQFTDFVKSHLWLSEIRTVDLGQVRIENNNVSLSGTLTTNEGQIYPVEYDFAEEEGVWKILHLEIFNTKPKIQPEVKEDKPLLFDKFALGTAVNSSGLVTNPSETFPSQAGELHLNLFIKNAKAGTKIDVLFQHIDSHSSAPSIAALVPEDGDVILSFAFAPPSIGWPKGNYLIEAKTATDVVGSMEFKVTSEIYDK